MDPGVPGRGAPPRVHFTMAYDPQHDVSVLFGGMGAALPGNEYYADTWTYSSATNTWVKVTPAASPLGRRKGQLAYAGHGTVVLFAARARSSATPGA